MNPDDQYPWHLNLQVSGWGTRGNEVGVSAIDKLIYDFVAELNKLRPEICDAFVFDRSYRIGGKP